jgi:hypothetical protein
VGNKANYSEGDCFSIPLREGGYARGVVARMDGEGIVFGYFFGPKIEHIADVFISDDLSPEQSVLSGQFGDLGLLNMEWQVIGSVSSWSRDEWVMPRFLRADPGDLTGILSTYDENSLKFKSEMEIDLSQVDVKNTPKDMVMGYGSVEIKLTRILSLDR